MMIKELSIISIAVELNCSESNNWFDQINFLIHDINQIFIIIKILIFFHRLLDFSNKFIISH
jgi:hypothetical protein